MINTILVGDVFETIKSIPDNYVDVTITSPPYWGLRNYGTTMWEGGREDCNHESAKIKTRFDYKFTGFQEKYKSSDAAVFKNECPDCGAIQKDFQLGNEPHYNMYIDKLICLFSEIKRITKPTGSIWVNLGDTYSTKPVGRFNGNPTHSTATSGQLDKTLSGVPNKSQIMVPERFAIRMIDDLGLIKRNTIIWKKKSVFPTSATDRFTNDFEYFFFFTVNPKYYFEQQLEPAKSTTLERLKYGLNNNKYNDDSIMGHTNTLSKPRKAKPLRERDFYRNKRTVWELPTAASEGRKSGEHVAPYPEVLVEVPVSSCCPVDGIVFDPFMGSGTTGAVAKKLNRNWLGCELNSKYADLAITRINNTERFLF